MKAGDKIKYLSYGEWKTGVVSHLSRDGKIVFLTNGKWLHRESAQLLQ